jgi:hypothetical protein
MSAMPDTGFSMPWGLPADEAAAALGVAEITLRRALAQARANAPGGRLVNGTCRDAAFLAWRDPRLPRAPWRFSFMIDFSDGESLARLSGLFARLPSPLLLRLLKERAEPGAATAG